jgi:hypothetical protein
MFWWGGEWVILPFDISFILTKPPRKPLAVPGAAPPLVHGVKIGALVLLNGASNWLTGFCKPFPMLFMAS